MNRSMIRIALSIHRNHNTRVSHSVMLTFAVCFAAFILFFSCTAPIDIHTKNSEQVPVIYGYLTDEFKNQLVRVTRSSPYFQKEENQIIADAKVWVTSSTGREYTFEHDSKGYYLSQRRFAAEPGVTYRLTVEVDFLDDGVVECYEAETTTLPVTPADSVSISMLSIMGFLHYSLNISMQDPPETENYYLFKYFINDTISNEKISDHLISDDALFNGQYMTNANVQFFNAASDFEETENNRDLFLVNPGDKIRLQVLNIEKEYYYFIRDCTMEKYGSNPFFGGPPSNVFTNLSNGAIGFFSSFCIQEFNTAIPDD